MSPSISGDPGVTAVGLEPARALDVGHELAASPLVQTVAVHTADNGDRYGSVVRATGDAEALAGRLAPVADVGLYRTVTRHCRRHRVTWPPGEPTPGIGMIYGVRRSPELTPREFHAHWADHHQPLALHHHVGMWDYRQVSVVEPLVGGCADYEGFAVVQFATEADMRERFFDSDDGMRVIRDDAARFTDGPGTDLVLMREYVLLDAPPPAGPVWVTDHRELELAVPASVVWDLISDFGAILAWWPGGLVGCRVEDAGTRRLLTRDDGSTITETLDEVRPDERMLVLSVIDGLPAGVDRYRCRYEVRATGAETCRLDWQPTALVEGANMAVFDAIVDTGWPQVETGLGRAVGQATA